MNGLTKNTDVSLNLDLAWNRLLSSHNNTIGARFLDFGSRYTLDGVDFSRNSIDYALTLTSRFIRSLDTYLEFSGETWSSLTTLNLTCGATFNW